MNLHTTTKIEAGHRPQGDTPLSLTPIARRVEAAGVEPGASALEAPDLATYPPIEAPSRRDFAGQPAHEPAHGFSPNESFKPLELQLLRTTIDGNQAITIVGLIGGDIVGQAKVWLEDPSILVDLFVHERFRGRGYGTRIVRYAMLGVPGPMRAYHLPDSPSRGILEKAGFVDTGQRGVDGGSPDYIWVQTEGIR